MYKLNLEEIQVNHDNLLVYPRHTLGLHLQFKLNPTDTEYLVKSFMFWRNLSFQAEIDTLSW